MKLAKKFVSLAAALAMGTCVYTVPVFAEDEGTPSTTDIAGSPETTDRTGEPGNTVSSGNGNNEENSLPQEQAETNISVAPVVSFADNNFFKYDSATQTLTVTLQVTGQPSKLELTFVENNSATLGNPTSVKLGETPLSPTISNPEKNSCTVQFNTNTHDFESNKQNSKTPLVLVFPVNSLIEQDVTIEMSINFGETPTEGIPIHFNAKPSIKISDYIVYDQDPFEYDAQHKKLTAEVAIQKELPGDLVYEVFWLSNNDIPSLVSPTVTFNGTAVTAKTSPQNITGSSPRSGLITTISSASLNQKGILKFTFPVNDGEDTQSVARVLDLHSKVWIDGYSADNESIVQDQKIPINDLETYSYTSDYDQATSRFSTLNVQVPESVFTGKQDLNILVGATPDGSVLSNVKSIKIGNKPISTATDLDKVVTKSINVSVLKDSLTIPGLNDSVTIPGLSNSLNLLESLTMYRIQIPYAQLNENMRVEDDKVSIAFDLNGSADSNTLAKSMVCAYTYTTADRGKELYVTPVLAYNISGTYSATANTWTVGILPSTPSVANDDGVTTINFTSTPNVITKLNSLTIGSAQATVNKVNETASADQNSETTSDSTQASDSTTDSASSNEVGEGPAVTLKEINSGYQLQIKNKDLQNLSSSEWPIKATFDTEKNFDTSKMTVTAESGTYKSDTYQQDIKAEVGDTSNVTFKGSHDYDSTKQTWTVNLAMSGKPNKLDLTFTQTEGTALGKPTSITVDGTAVSPTVNTQMSGSTMSVCTVDFRQEDLDKIKADSKVTLVFPIDGSKEQSERILMNVDLGNSNSKDLSAKFTVKKSSTSPSSSSNVHTATESGMSTMLVVAAVALAAFAVFGVLAFKKKKSK